jgi:hypothetical protein
MAWPVTDFDGVQFNDGTGYAEVVAIHKAIKQRAEAIGHSLASGAYADPWTATPIWLADPSRQGVGDTRVYLRDVLQGFYDDIIDMLDSDTDIRFVESVTANATEWTEASLVTAIGMGDFVYLLTKPANHEPFLWLHEALDRLIYPRVTVESGVFTSQARSVGTTIRYLDKQVAWNNRDGGGGGGRSVSWILTIANSFHGAGVTDGVTYPFNMSGLSGVTSLVEYEMTFQNEGNIPITFTFGSASRLVYAGTAGITEWVAASSIDLPTGTSSDALLEFVDAEPATVPFSTPGEIFAYVSGSIDQRKATARTIIALSTILDDQT